MADPPPANCWELGSGKTPPGVGTLKEEAVAGFFNDIRGPAAPGGAKRELGEDITEGLGEDKEEAEDEEEEEEGEGREVEEEPKEGEKE